MNVNKQNKKLKKIIEMEHLANNRSKFEFSKMEKQFNKEKKVAIEVAL